MLLAIFWNSTTETGVSKGTGENGTYLRTVDSIRDRKLVASANLKVVSPAQAGVKCCLGCDASKIGPRPCMSQNRVVVVGEEASDRPGLVCLKIELS